MIPAGEERDKRIAEIRGDTCIAYSVVPIKIHTAGPACMKKSIAFPDCHNCLMFLYPKYSTDINAAMELWEEMKSEIKGESLNSKGELYLSFNNPDFMGPINCEIIDMGRILSSRGDTEADAISGVYLKWKVSQ
jgi:hypothetical protein